MAQSPSHSLNHVRGFDSRICTHKMSKSNYSAAGLDLLLSINLNGIWLCFSVALLPAALFASEYLRLPKIKQTEVT